jgi:hypothetical protein
MCPPEHPWVIADGALGTVAWDGDFATSRKLTGDRLGLREVSPVAA